MSGADGGFRAAVGVWGTVRLPSDVAVVAAVVGVTHRVDAQCGGREVQQGNQGRT